MGGRARVEYLWPPLQETHRVDRKLRCSYPALVKYIRKISMTNQIRKDKYA